ncbi:flagellar hook capping FlgD N-terminal domain-containing protein [Vogesella sp. LIG4]|uniref:flagellar hook capping FlgD N-terminal domain-containing protein n=1 Tax=Vogesella sp. LIG4 TaxID=1192162 RepID=UPI00081FD1AE|nr:flagellar hook capping FlgD N-terminal domain-containing protein [Vogesella sp. LIG4]SCK17603.1 flagellar basal-body rod modification protein FlgD [Vogesella sp. LIG4]
MQTTLNNTAQSGSSGSSDAILAATNGAQLSDMFTKLLVAQIQNQDPLSPTDPSQFVSQLTQLSQVEALNKMSSQTGSGNGMLQNLQTLALGGQVGASVMVQTGNVELGSSPLHGAVNLDNNTAQLNLTLTGSDGQPHVLALGPQVAGPVSFNIDPAALGLPAGSYSIAARTDSGASPTVEIGGTINSVRVGSNGSAVLNISGVGSIDAAAITQFNGRPAA